MLLYSQSSNLIGSDLVDESFAAMKSIVSTLLIAGSALSYGSLIYSNLPTAPVNNITSLDFNGTSAERIAATGGFANEADHALSLTSSSPVNYTSPGQLIFTNATAVSSITFTFNFLSGLTSGSDVDNPFVDYTENPAGNPGSAGFQNTASPRLAVAGRTPSVVVETLEFSLNTFASNGFASGPLDITPGGSNSTAFVREFAAPTTRTNFNDFVNATTGTYDFSNPNLAVFSSPTGSDGIGVQFVKDNIDFITDQSQLDRYTYAIEEATITFNAAAGETFAEGTEFRFSLDGVSAVPEPTSGLLGLIGLSFALVRRR